MLAIKSIEVVEIDRDRLVIQERKSINNVRVYDTGKKPHMMDVASALEIIEGRRFVNANGKEFCVGMSKQVQDAIGIPFEAFEDMSNTVGENCIEITKLYAETVTLKRELKQHKEAGFWKRLKYLLKWDELNAPIIWPTVEENNDSN